MTNNNEDIKKEEPVEETAEEKETAETSADEQTEAPEKAEENKEPEEDADTRYIRLMADFQNYKKRVEKEKKIYIPMPMRSWLQKCFLCWITSKEHLNRRPAETDSKRVWI